MVNQLRSVSRLEQFINNISIWVARSRKRQKSVSEPAQRSRPLRTAVLWRSHDHVGALIVDSHFSSAVVYYIP